MIFYYQAEIDNFEVSVDFIMDNATNIKKSQEKYAVTAHPSPLINSDGYKTVDYVSIWPCKHKRIIIEVCL